MDDPLILARAVHFIATIMAGGAVFFAGLVAEPAFQEAGPDGGLAAHVRLQLTRIAWISLALALISGVAWLILTTEEMSDRPLAAVFTENVIWTVLARTGFGHDWLVRFVLVGLLVGMLLRPPAAQQTRLHRMAAAAIAAALVGTLAWAGHAVGTPGIAGGIHLVADVLHLVAVAAWLGALVPLGLLLRAVRNHPDEGGLAVAQAGVLRFSTLGVASVATILVTGSVNTWFLAGSVPALLGTDYGRLLLVKVALFLVMVSIAAVNRFRLTPRLVHAQSLDALRQLERNSAIEAVVGGIILVIVAVLGTLPPGLHEQPIWPFSVRIDGAVFDEPDLYIEIIFGVAWIALGVVMKRFRWPAIALGAAILVVLGFRMPIIEAYPTTFFGSPTGFTTQSIASGEDLFLAHCASCHGPQGRGDGPAGASLKIMPADLTADHVYGHSDGDLFWWISHGIDPAMPAFDGLLDEQARWNLIEFIRANADATRLRMYGGGTTAAFPAPDFSAVCPDGSTVAMARLGPQIAHIVVSGPGSEDRLHAIAERDTANKLRTIVIASDPEAAKNSPLCVTREPETIQTFALYRGAAPVEGTEFLVDAAGNLRSMWQGNEIANAQEANALRQRLQGLRIPPRVQRPSSVAGHTHTH